MEASLADRIEAMIAREAAAAAARVRTKRAAIMQVAGARGCTLEQGMTQTKMATYDACRPKYIEITSGLLSSKCTHVHVPANVSAHA